MDERKKKPRTGLQQRSRQRTEDRKNKYSRRRRRQRTPAIKSSRARRRRRNLIIRIILLTVILIAAAGGFFIWLRYGSSKETFDLEDYYGVSDEDDLAIVIDNSVISGEDADTPAGRMIDGEAYVEYSIVTEYINDRFYWDSNENVLLYTLPTGNVTVSVGSQDYTEITENKSEDYVILKTEGQVAYIALDFIRQYTNIDYNIYDDTVNRAVVTCTWGEIETATVKRDTQIRYQGGVKSPILTEVAKSDKVTVLEDEDGWKKVATEDGVIGYIKTGALKDISTETISRDFDEPEYTNISTGYTINMAWHNVENEDANNYILETIAETKGLTTIAPTWFTIADTSGNLSSLASAEYVTYAHQSGLDVWATLRDFHGGINSYDETYEVLSYTSKRENLINQVIAAALQTGIDGINLDFELISSDCAEHYIQFVRELSVKCRQNGIVFSIDNYVPQSYNEYYDLEEQSVMADYIVIMAYDEHTEGSYEAGSVASYSYVKEGITNALESVSNSKLVLGIPFYTRLWTETPKTAEELAEDAGTEAEMYANNVTSTALGMEEAQTALAEAGVTAEWDETTRQNYAEWETEEGTCKIWLEDSASLAEKLSLVTSEELAGVAEWKLGQESSDVWDLILQYVN